MTSKRNMKDNFTKKLLSYISTAVKFWLMQVRVSSAEILVKRQLILSLDWSSRLFYRHARTIYYDLFFQGTEQKLNNYLLLDTMSCAVLGKAELAALSLKSVHNVIKCSPVTRKVITLQSSGKKRITVPVHLKHYMNSIKSMLL